MWEISDKLTCVLLSGLYGSTGFFLYVMVTILPEFPLISIFSLTLRLNVGLIVTFCNILKVYCIFVIKIEINIFFNFSITNTEIKKRFTYKILREHVFLCVNPSCLIWKTCMAVSKEFPIETLSVDIPVY